MTVHCRQCGHQWEAAVPVPAPIQVATAAMRAVLALGCPRCGADGRAILCGPASSKVARAEAHLGARRAE